MAFTCCCALLLISLVFVKAMSADYHTHTGNIIKTGKVVLMYLRIYVCIYSYIYITWGSSGTALLCCPDEVQGPLSKVLQDQLPSPPQVAGARGEGYLSLVLPTT